MPHVECQFCKKDFYVKNRYLELGWGKYCSRICRSKGQLRGKSFHCLICSIEIYRSPSEIEHSKSGKFFCGKRCQTRWKNSKAIGEKHPNWLSGIRVYRDILIRSGIEQICARCFEDDKRVLIVHHIDHNRQNNAQSNLIWVCLNCHYLIHHHNDAEIYFKKRLFQIRNVNGDRSSAG